MSKTSKRLMVLVLLFGFMFSFLALGSSVAQASPPGQGGGSDPPAEMVKLIFIHHSTGENWLTDGYGNLGQSLAENNYYVSDTNYGWGPDGIGDRTDIPDWEEWFTSDHSARYMDALYNEGEQHADYTRTGTDPGGENQIVMFKSCFPNSDLEGNPGDPPSEEGWLSVGHAKYVYNQILEYFGQHPEKLFVVITAPPLSDRSNAANARAFNQWLMNDWLDENDYELQNVAVFDFYNVLTGKDGRHTFENGEEIHHIASKDTLAYPSGDDHPSKKGSQKATEEFIPLLNYFYNRWQATAPAPLAETAEDVSSSSPGEGEDSPPAAPPSLAGLIDDFEGEAPFGTNGWEAYWDEGTPSSLRCGAESGSGSSGNALRLEYQITAYSWGTCGISYDNPQDWSDSSGLAFKIHTQNAQGPLHIDLFAEGTEGHESYLYQLELDPGMDEGWVQVGIVWDYFQRVEWEEDAGSPFSKPDRISGIAFGFGTGEEEQNGELWIDDVGWMIPGGDAPQGEESSPEFGSGPGPEEESGGFNLPCIGSLALPMSVAGFGLVRRRKTNQL